MPGFNIEFEKRQTTIPAGSPLSYGCITIGNFHERFEASVEFWSETDYVCHWQRSIQRIIERVSTSCLITSLTDPKTATFLFWWPIYRLGDVVYFQNHVLFLDEIGADFDPQNPYRFVRDRETVSEDGSPVSEWSAPISSLIQFLEIPGEERGQGECHED